MAAIDILRHFLQDSLTKNIEEYMGVKNYYHYMYINVKSITWFDFCLRPHRIGGNALCCVETYNTSYGQRKKQRLEWYNYGKLHRLKGPASLWYRLDEEGGCHLEKQTWCINGEQHRIDDPAIVEYHENGCLYMEAWYQRGRNWRWDGPSVIFYDQEGILESKLWYDHCGNNEELHRYDGPAVLKYYQNGEVKEEEWRYYGDLCRPGGSGPFRIDYHSNGKKSKEKWGYKGILSRWDGPALVIYDINGKIIEQHCYKDGKLMKSS